MSKIKSVKAREILDSRRKPTLEVELQTSLGKFLASVPSGTSRGKYEAAELAPKIAIKNVNKIIGPKLRGKDSIQQKEIDQFLIKLDGTKNKSHLGTNAILGVSMAVCRAGAKAKNLPLWQWISKIARVKPSLPTPCLLFIEGGLHGKGNLDIQEFMVFIKENSFKEKFKRARENFQSLGKILTKKYPVVAKKLGLEGAFTPPLKDTKTALNLLIEAAKKKPIKIILDAAASTFFKKGKYYFEKKKLNKDELLDFYLELSKIYPIAAIEDPFAENDWQGWKKLKSKIKKEQVPRQREQKSKILLIGDDLTVTNPERIRMAYRKKACNAVILKPNQIGTVTETIMAAKLAKSFGWKTIVSHRSGETMDSFIADLAVGIGADFIKAGAPTQKERMAKYNRLLEIEEELK
jgi:enolase